MNVLPIVRRRVSWMDAERFDGIDGLEDFFDLGPTGETQERFSARTHIRDCRITLAWSHRSQNIDARKGRAIVIGSPANPRNRGRDPSYLAPPAQNRTGPIRAYGSHLGCLTAKRAS